MYLRELLCASKVCRALTYDLQVTELLDMARSYLKLGIRLLLKTKKLCQIYIYLSLADAILDALFL